MIFETEEAIKTKQLIPEEEVELLLEQRNVEWKKRVKLEQIKSHREGYEKGYNDGSREATEKTYASTKEEITQSFSSLQETFNHIENNIKELHQTLEAGVCSLIFSIAEQVIGIPIYHAKLEEKLKAELEKIFKSMDEAQKIELWCSPNDQQHIASLTANFEASTTLVCTELPVVKLGVTTGVKLFSTVEEGLFVESEVELGASLVGAKGEFAFSLDVLTWLEIAFGSTCLLAPFSCSTSLFAGVAFF